MKKMIYKILLVSALAVLVVTACSGQASTNSQDAPPIESVLPQNAVVAEGRIEPIRATNLSFFVRGVVEDVLVKPGDKVSEGDVLARLSNSGQAEAQLVIAQNDYDTLLRNESGDRARLWQAYLDAQAVRGEAQKKWNDLDQIEIRNTIEEDKSKIQDMKSALNDAQDEFDKYKDLKDDNSTRQTAEKALNMAQKDYDDAVIALETDTQKRDDIRALYDAALAAEAEAKHQYEISLDGPNADQLALANANLEAAKDALANYVITAPFNGVVADVDVKAGEQVGAETRIVSIIDTSKWIVKTTDVTELEVVKISVGQKAEINPDALPDAQMSGTVTEISNAYTQQGGDILYTVQLELDKEDPDLKWGMTVEVIFRTIE